MDKIFTLEDFLNGRVLIKIENDDPCYEELLREIESLGVKWPTGHRPTEYRPNFHFKYLYAKDGVRLYVDNNYDELYFVRRACEIMDVSNPVDVDKFKELI